MLLNHYIETLTEGQQLIIKDVIAEGDRSNSTKAMLAAIRRLTAEAFLELWGEDIFPAKVKLGYEPEWESLDIDWPLSMAMAFKKKSGGITGFIAKALSLETMFLNFCYGLKLPSNISKEGREEAGTAIIIAALLSAE